MKKEKQTAGYTLLELVTALAILAVLLSASLGTLTQSSFSARLAAQAVAREMQTCIELSRLKGAMVRLRTNSSSLTRFLGENSRSIKLPAGITLSEANFGFSGSEVRFYPGSTCSPGKLQLRDSSGQICGITLSLRGMTNIECL